MATYANEHAFNAAWTNELRSKGAFVQALVGSMMQVGGMPDRVVHHPRWHGYLEGKFKNGKPTLLQVHMMEDIAARQFPVHVIRWTGHMIQLETPRGIVQASEVGMHELLDVLVELRL